MGLNIFQFMLHLLLKFIVLHNSMSTLKLLHCHHASFLPTVPKFTHSHKWQTGDWGIHPQVNES